MKPAWLSMLALLLTSCRALLGSFDECGVDTDCTSRGANLACVDRLCVTRAEVPLDARCTRLGPSTADPITFGSLMPKTRADGGVNLTGVAREQALLLALEQLNPPVRQGIRGRSLNLIACDSQSSAATAADLARHLATQQVPAVFTSGSAETIAASAVTVPAGMLELSVSASAPEITDLPDLPTGSASDSAVGLVWRTSASDVVQGRVIGQWLVDAGTPKTAVIHVNDTYGQGLSQTFALNYPLGQSEAFPYARGGDVTLALDHAVGFAPTQLLIITFPDDAANLLSGLAKRPALANLPRFFTDAAKDPSILTLVGSDGALGTAPAPAPPGSEARQYFVTQYQQRFALDPLTVSATANAFDAMMCLALSAYQAKGDLSGETLPGG